MRLKFGQYDPLFRGLIDQAQERHPRLLPEAVDTEDFSLWRSPRQGLVLETTNQDLAEKVIELINRWHKKEAAKGSEAGLPMRQACTQVRSTHDVFRVPRCHLGRFINPGYPIGAKSEACGRAKDNVLWANRTDTIVPSG